MKGRISVVQCSECNTCLKEDYVIPRRQKRPVYFCDFSECPNFQKRFYAPEVDLEPWEPAKE